MQIESNDKIKIFDNKIIVATTGSIGCTQRFHRQLDASVEGKVFINFKHDRLTQHISKKFIDDMQNSGTPYNPQFGGLGSAH